MRYGRVFNKAGHFLDITANNCKKTFDKRRAIHYNSLAMRDWRNRQTRTFKGRVGDRVSSSLTSRTNKKQHFSVLLFCYVQCLRAVYNNLQWWLGARFYYRVNLAIR